MPIQTVVAYPLLEHQAQAPVQHGMADGTQALYGGFEVWPGIPATSSDDGFSIIGSDFSQVLEIALQAGETVTAEPGTMLHMTSGMGLDADMGGLGQSCKRCCCAGESMFRLHLQNKSQQVQKVGLTPRFPAKVVPVDLAAHSGLIINRGAFLAAFGTEWKVNIQRVGGMAVCCCGGQGLFMNTLHGSGMAFLNAGGTVMTKILAEGEEIIVDPHSVLAFEKSVTLGVRRTGGCMVCCCAGQGLFNATLTGPGFVMVHSMALAKLRQATGGGPQAGAGGQANAAGSS